ncbi:hypothetical protein [Alloprevotella tannerae]|uniref:hypothetical protein n=1 Tax=Alloprevotella tannerae TaxID=76122 RepID=UPI0025D12DBC|nr:hypothetical protein [Alloprevotella tannerae]
MFKVNDKIKDAFSAFLGALLLLLFAGGSGWMAFIMFQRGSWLIGVIGVIGAVFFSSPLWAGLFITKKEPESEPVVTKVDWLADKAALLKLAQTVAGDDAEVMQLVKDSLASPEASWRANMPTSIMKCWTPIKTSPILCAARVCLSCWKNYASSFGSTGRPISIAFRE